jgi:cholesterol transport system auxiliary component
MMHGSRFLTSALARAALLGLVAFAPAGCVKFGGKPPAALLTIDSAEKVATGASADPAKGVFTIIEPDVPKALGTVRVAVRAADDSYAYIPGAVWVDVPRNLFRAVLAESVAARTGGLVLDPGQYAPDPGIRVMGTLIAFGIDARTNRATVTYDASLMAHGGITTRRRFSASVPVGRIDAATAAPAIGKAASQVAVEVADWLATAR